MQINPLPIWWAVCCLIFIYSHVLGKLYLLHCPTYFRSTFIAQGS